MKVLEDLIREMDRKIAKSKERAEAESSARPLKPDDAARLAEMQAKAKGEQSDPSEPYTRGNTQPQVSDHPGNIAKFMAISSCPTSTHG